jgi:glutathione S-transferase
MDIQLHYFSGRGIGEPIRLTLVASGIPFIDHRYSTTDPSWRNKLDKHLPFGQMPALEVNGTFIAQADSCGRLAAKLAKLYPDDPVKAAQTDMVVVHQSEIQKAIARLSFDGVPGAEGTKMVPEKERAILINDWMNESLPDLLRRLEDLCGEPFVVGETLTWADINVFCRLAQLLDINPMILDRDYPKLKSLETYVRRLPAIAAWIEAHPEDYLST